MKIPAVRVATLWLTGLPASGKTTLAHALCEALRAQGKQAVVLDGDTLRQSISSDLGFSEVHRHEHNRRVASLATVLNRQGVYTVVSLISPYRLNREQARQMHIEQSLNFFEVFVNTPLEVCIQRDPKGLYAKALAKELTQMTGVDAPYEIPQAPEFEVTPEISLQKAVKYILVGL